MKIRDFRKSDFPTVKSIYQQGIDTGNATFQLKAKEWDEWNKYFLNSCRIVAELNGVVIGWAALSAVSKRFVYSGVAEVSLYVSSEHSGKGKGYLLLSELINKSEQEGIWTLQAGVFPENQASINIHLKNDFKKLGIREKLGKMNGLWRDILLMERRSKVIGV
ncbi:GNAT family N-acetyltransferase [Amylibacter sp.]|nr:GNAT family N-acetyltransferase [Amylibacter sp.]